MISNQTSKSSNLNSLRNKLSMFNVPHFISFNVSQYKEDSNKVLVLISKQFDCNFLAVRSSTSDEDSVSNSLAGEYESVLNVPSSNSLKIIDAINIVIASYEKKRGVLKGDEVIIQEMVENSSMSGVIFTHDLNTGAPYYVINYDDQSGTTDSVTSGNIEYSNRTLYVHRDSSNRLKSERFIVLLQAIKELEALMGSHFLDIEFVLGKDLTPFLLQVRAITTKSNWNRAIVKRVDTTLQGLELFVSDRLEKTNGFYGASTILGQMPDWNPVEMIGRTPRSLATSLYKQLITDNAWRQARSDMGYSVPKGQPLMITLAGQPFIDTRLSFHSFLPNNLSATISEKLVNHWVNNLKKFPELHDKIEFNIAITSYSFDIEEKIELLIGDILSVNEKKEFIKCHLDQTMMLIDRNHKSSISGALKKIDFLKGLQEKYNKLNKDIKDLSILFSIIEDCIQYGTIPFSILARHGFIAKTILMSLYNKDILTLDEVNYFQSSIQTVASELVDDMHLLENQKISYAKFMIKYGHLRPGTYDILSTRYDQMPDFIGDSMTKNSKKRMKEFQFSYSQKLKINELLLEVGFRGFDANNLLNYIREAIIGREYGKFIFTRSVSEILEIIAHYAKSNGLSRDEISHVPLDELLKTFTIGVESTNEERLRKVSETEKELNDISMAIRLPQLITNPSDVYIIPFQVSHPNFITNKKITAEYVILDSEINNVELNGKIVIIEGADPGYDWIFSKKITGLITKYGGANSHMAIRCAEFKIPAAIGCGEQRFNQLLEGNKVHIDCAAGLIHSLI